ncbi:hybrid sensor histidine kinase/response regulator [Ohtaekwangia koreensis]|uniref:histidine kinase n=1 Tax=Ohtaekwangia koreensis TaxID=688867 RepID=A0A1T5JTJ3_9BACT|nr:response regulator [Ohtaekwangia koreensis]SKC54736.1 PAS domain S-box-containing protein [Ohtaekwangia koreensis]
MNTTPSRDTDIILVENNDQDSELITRTLAKNSILNNTIRLKNAGELLDFLFEKGSYETITLKHLPKVILMDVSLPDNISGLEALKQLRSNKATRNIPVMIFTSGEGDHKLFEQYKLGVTTYIHKKLDFEKFEEALLQVQLYLKTYRILILEDNPDDAELLLYEIASFNIQLVSKIASNKEEYILALESFDPDVVIADFNIPPNFDAIQAIRLLRKKNPRVPFILISGGLTEEFAAGCLSEGIDDYLLKSNLKRFPISLTNMLRKKKTEDEKDLALQMLKESEERYRKIIETAQEGIWVLDAQNQTIFVNKRLAEMLEFTEEEMMTRSFFAFMDEEDRARSIEHFKKLEKGKKISLGIKLNSKTGKKVWTSISGNPLYNKEGHYTGAFGMITDITALKTVQFNLESKITELNAFLYHTSHVLRGPVSSSRGLINVLKMVSQDSEEQDFLKMLDDCNVEMITMLEELTRISTLYYKPFIHDRIDFEELVRDVIHDLREYPKSEKATFTIYADKDISFYSDPFIIKPIFLCLFKNSITYSDDSRECEITVNVQQENKTVKIEVIDNGDGIPLEFQSRVFDMFYRAHKKARGPGLGLYIVRHIIERLNGKISLQSEKDIGTTITLMIPIPTVLPAIVRHD